MILSKWQQLVESFTQIWRECVPQIISKNWSVHAWKSRARTSLILPITRSASLPRKGCEDSTTHNTGGLDVALDTSRDTATLTPAKTGAGFGNAFTKTLVSHSLHHTIQDKQGKQSVSAKPTHNQTICHNQNDAENGAEFKLCTPKEPTTSQSSLVSCASDRGPKQTLLSYHTATTRHPDKPRAKRD